MWEKVWRTWSSDILGKPIFYRKSARGYQLAVIDGGTGYFLFVEEGKSPQ